jgi:hypothetical protein
MEYDFNPLTERIERIISLDSRSLILRNPVLVHLIKET